MGNKRQKDFRKLKIYFTSKILYYCQRNVLFKSNFIFRNWKIDKTLNFDKDLASSFKGIPKWLINITYFFIQSLLNILPTVIITDAEGKIIFADLTDNYRVRPEPDTFLKVIDEIDKV